jgi:hypothetical protein
MEGDYQRTKNQTGERNRQGANCRFLLELSLLDSAYRLPGKNAEDVLFSTAKRHRIDTEKIEKEVAQKFSAAWKKSGNKPTPKKTVA